MVYLKRQRGIVGVKPRSAARSTTSPLVRGPLVTEPWPVRLDADDDRLGPVARSE